MSIASSGTITAHCFAAKYAPPNNAIASTGEKFGGCGSRRVNAATMIKPARASGPGAKAVEAGRFMSCEVVLRSR